MADSAGVELRESDYSNYVQAISEVSVGCIGEARRGPLEPTLITSQKELVSIFGEPIEGYYGLYGAYCALANVSKLWYQRVVGKGEKASAGQLGLDKFIYSMNVSGSEYNGYTLSQNIDDNGVISLILSNKKGEELERFENLSDNLEDDNYIVGRLEEDSIYLVATENPVGSVITKEFTFSGGVEGATNAIAGTADTEFCLRSKYPDSTINGCKFVVGAEDNYGYFDAKLVDASGNNIETFSNITRKENDDRYIIRVINSISNRVQIYTNINFNDKSTNEYVFKGGKDGIDTINDFDVIGNISDNTGIQAFNNSESIEINLLMIPGNTSASVNAAAVTLAEDRGDIIYIADTPRGLTAQEAKCYADGSGIYEGSYVFNSSYAAMYYPWVYVADPYTKKNILLPPSGAVVAQYAFNDSNSYPWFAPAGLNRGVLNNVVSLERNPNKGERGILYGGRNCINPIVKFTGSGIVLWGQKTTQRKCSALDRVNVRRLMNYLKKMILEASRYYVFEINDQITWNKWIDMVETNLNNVKNQRGIYDMKIEMHPTSNEIDNYQMPGNIKIKPSKSAEFINLNFMLMPSDASFDENNI